MKLHFLGTGAADWKGPDERGEHRRMTSTLIDNALLIDLTEEALPQIPSDAQIADVLITHSHDDHFSVAALEQLHPARVYIHESWAQEISIPGVEVCPVKVGQWIRAGAFEVLPMPSNHSTSRTYETTLHYIIRRDEQTFLYALDGAWLLNEELKLMQGMTLCGAAMDATIGDGHEGDFRVFEHNSIEMVRIMTDTMKHTGLLAADAPVFLTHLARTLHPAQKKLEESLSFPFIACHDGLEWTL